ncbi:MAG: dTDP-4-dehydrorhamnose 3,5-epimerase [Cyclobacteriaceae bacterium]|jgi:dTDP-4-dehydrorhamnose 3,5-epimerase|nr:dTDP-4-dehydrorhamnose 3,5-epimerase [Cyclobacteriaceae bacterium]
MQIIETGFAGLVEIQPSVYRDSRGWFIEFYKDEVYQKHGITDVFYQENISFSKKGVIRGLHFQLPPFEQAKLVSVISGKVLDVVVDIRKNSPTFGQVYTCLLDGEKQNQLMVPGGFAHGFAALEDAYFLYKVSNRYSRESECGIRWDDPDLNIQWPVSEPIISDKDSKLPSFRELLGKSLISRT